MVCWFSRARRFSEAWRFVLEEDVYPRLPLARGLPHYLILLLSFLLAVGARVSLGTNWSGTVTVKQEHELITSGPYRYVRHPIYTGLLLAFSGLAIARGEWRCILALIILALSFWRKLRIEERFMVEQFGSAYETYRQRVSVLVPFVI